MPNFKTAAIAAAVACLPFLSGCGSLRLYSETRDKQGAAAKDAWSKVDLTAIVTTERSNLKNLLDTELETQDSLATSIRDNRLQYIVEASSLEASVEQPAEELLKGIAGSTEKVAASRKKIEEERARALSIGAFLPDFERRELEIPACSSLVNGATPKELAEPMANDAEFKLIVDKIRKECSAPDAVYSDFYLDIVYPVFKGDVAIRRALDRYSSELKRLEATRDGAASLQAAYKKALKEYDDALARRPDDKGVVHTVQEAAEKVKKAVADLQGASDAFSIRFLSEERLKSLDDFLEAVTETKPGEAPPKGANDATIAFVVFPALFDDARKALADSKKPLAMPLLLRRNQAQLNLESANREIAAHETLVRLYRELLDALYAESVQLWLVTRDLNLDGTRPNGCKRDDTEPKCPPAINTAKFLKVSVQDAFKHADPNAKEVLLMGTTRYLDVLKRLEARRYKLEYMIIAASYERALANAEVNMKQWQSLIGTGIDQLADYSAGGIKAEQITNLLNAAALIWIGNGVNK